MGKHDEAKANLKAARADLASLTGKDKTSETDRYNEKNRAVIAAEAKLPWHKR